MKKILLFLFLPLILNGSCNIKKEQQIHSVPYFLVKYSDQYKKSPREAALAWFEDARLGMFIHWGVWGKYHAAWAMFNNRIPWDEYQKTAKSVDAF